MDKKTEQESKDMQGTLDFVLALIGMAIILLFAPIGIWTVISWIIG